MNKDQVVAVMSDVVNNLNFQVALEQGAPIEDAKSAIEAHQPHLVYVNGLIYDRLLEEGLLK
jgi:hypothetical protein